MRVRVSQRAPIFLVEKSADGEEMSINVLVGALSVGSILFSIFVYFSSKKRQEKKRNRLDAWAEESSELSQEWYQAIQGAQIEIREMRLDSTSRCWGFDQLQKIEKSHAYKLHIARLLADLQSLELPEIEGVRN